MYAVFLLFTECSIYLPEAEYRQKTVRIFHFIILFLKIRSAKKEIYDTASSYSIAVTDFTEHTATNLVVSYNAKDFDEETSRYIEVYRDKEMAAIFVSESDFEKISGQDITVAPGTYQTITTTDYNNFYEYEDGLQEVMNPDTEKIISSHLWG